MPPPVSEMLKSSELVISALPVAPDTSWAIELTEPVNLMVDVSLVIVAPPSPAVWAIELVPPPVSESSEPAVFADERGPVRPGRKLGNRIEGGADQCDRSVIVGDGRNAVRPRRGLRNRVGAAAGQREQRAGVVGDRGVVGVGACVRRDLGDRLAIPAQLERMSVGDRGAAGEAALQDRIGRAAGAECRAVVFSMDELPAVADAVVIVAVTVIANVLFVDVAVARSSSSSSHCR